MKDGADTKISKNSLVGVNLTYAASNIKSQTGLQNTKIDSYQFNLYSGHEYKDYFVNSVLGLVWNEYSGQRSIPVAAVVARSNYSGQSYVARIELGKQNRMGNNFIITPTLMLTAAHNRVSDYEENGAGTLNLNIKNDSTNFLEGRAGLEIRRYFFFNKKRLLPRISTSYGYDFIGDEQKSISNFTGQTTTFASQGSKVAQGSLKLGAGMEFFHVDTATLSLDYSFERRRDYQSHYGALRFKFGF